MTVAEVDGKIRELKAQIREWQKIREDVINKTTLFPESQIFIDGSFKAAEALRKAKPELFCKKCIEMNFGEDRKVFGLNRQHFCQKWEGAKAKACHHASHGRTKAPIHLSENELKLAKIYALSYAKEMIEFWEGDICDESWKKNRS